MLCDSIFLRQFERMAQLEGALPAGRSDPAIVPEIFRRQWLQEAARLSIVPGARLDVPVVDRVFQEKFLCAAEIFGLLTVLADSTLSVQFLNGGGLGGRQRIEGPTDTALFTAAPLGSFSHSFWYRCDALQPQFHGPVGSATTSAFQNGWGIYRDTTDNEARIFIDAFNTSFFQFTQAGIWTVSGWHNLAFTFDDVNRQVTAWWDGIQHQSAVNAISTIRDLGGAVSFGASDTGGGTSTDFEGKVDTAAFWVGHIMNSTEAVALYNGGNPVVPSSVIADPDWSIVCGEDPADDITIVSGQVTDVSGNGNHFTPQAADNIPAMNFNADVP